MTLKQVWSDQDFVDVTLATGDGRQLDVHKVLISSASPFFRNVLKNNPHQKPLIYLKDIVYDELLLIMKFIYLGQCNVANDRLEGFLATSRELDINGLNEDMDLSKLNVLQSPELLTENSDDNAMMENKEQIVYIQENGVKEEAETKHTVPEGSQNVRDDHIQKIEGKTKFEYPCPKCGKGYERIGALKLHIKNYCRKLKSKIMKSTDSHVCNLCNKQFQSSRTLHAHVKNTFAHADKTPINCNFCPEIRYGPSKMEMHLKSVHVSRKCDKCEEIVEGGINLKRHKDSKHHVRTMINFTCPICGEFIKFNHRLKEHNKKHTEYQLIINQLKD